MPRTRKPKIFPVDIVVDSREQAPFAFLSIEPWDQIPTVTAALPTGDYSLRGFEDRVTVERKSISDFYGSIGADRERFEREMIRMAAMQRAFVVIEGMVADRPETVQMSAKSATHTMLSWANRYGVHFLECKHGRREAELKTFHILRHFWKQEQERLNEFAWIDAAIDEVMEPTLF